MHFLSIRPTYLSIKTFLWSIFPQSLSYPWHVAQNFLFLKFCLVLLSDVHLPGGEEGVPVVSSHLFVYYTYYSVNLPILSDLDIMEIVFLPLMQ